MPSGYTRHLVVSPPYPVYADRAEGCWIHDVDGNRYIDFVNNFRSSIHGHNNKVIVEAVTRQANRLMSAIFPCEGQIELAEILADRIPGVERTRFTNSGTEAVLIAVKAARAYTNRTKIAKLEGAYHGQHDLVEISHQPDPGAWGPAHAPASVGYQAGTPASLLDEVVVLPTNDLDATRHLLNTQADSLAAVLVDPHRVHLGEIEPTLDYVRMLREETARLGVVLVFDEVMSLRVGYHGRQGQIGVTPDLTTMGKIIGGGLPIGALGGTREHMSVFEVDGFDAQVKHSGTFTANSMSMAAGAAGMRLLTRGAFADLERRAQRLRDGLAKELRASRLAARVDGTGSHTSVSFMARAPATYRELVAMSTPEVRQRQTRLRIALLNNGVLTARGFYTGSTAMADDDIDFAVDASARAFRDLASE